MVIAVEKNLDKLALALRREGYHTVIYGEYNYPIDALVYGGGEVTLTKAHVPKGSPRGVFMVDALGKSEREVISILNRRLYEPLF